MAWESGEKLEGVSLLISAMEKACPPNEGGKEQNQIIVLIQML